MVAKANLRVKTVSQRWRGQRVGLGGWLALIMVAGSLALVGCERPAAEPDQSTAPDVTPERVPEGTPERAPEGTVAPGEPTPAATPAPGSDPVAQAPTEVPASPGAPLPDPLVNQWEPMSNVLVAFGTMTITPSQVTWSSGQSSSYSLVSTEGGFLLKLEANPRFYDTPNPFIKLIPETNEAGVVTSIDVAFYDSEAQLQKDEYIMYGSYFGN